MRVLLVEGDAALGEFVGSGLGGDGHEVDLACDRESALRIATRTPPDLMILDLDLPRGDGLEVLMELRDRFCRSSLLLLTGRAEVEERVRCLNLGADDLMLKPFFFPELVARCNALARRRQQFADPILRCGDLEMNRMARRVVQAGREISLTATEFTLLECLMRRNGLVSGRDELLREVWRVQPGEASGTNIVEVYINYLRKKLGMVRGDAGRALIRTIRGAGYLIRTEAAADVSLKRRAAAGGRFPGKVAHAG